MDTRLLPRDLNELYAHALALEGAAAAVPRAWEYAPHFLGARAEVARAPRNVREALTQAIATEPRTQNFYVDEGRHIARLERLLAREPDAAAAPGAGGDVLPLKT